MRRRDLLGGLSLVPLAVPAVAQCVLPSFPRINLADRCEGGGNPPSLDLSFMVPGSLDPRLTFTRASTGTYFDAAGVMQTATTNTPRWDYAAGVLQGMLLEEARTNLLLNSATLSTQSVTVTAVAHTLSFYGTGTVTKSGVATGALVGTGVGQRVSQTFTPTAGSLTLTVTGTVSNAQVEVGAFATSYIPTTGATATRAVELCDMSPLGTWFSLPAFTQQAEWLSYNYASASGGVLRFDDVSNVNMTRLLLASAAPYGAQLNVVSNNVTTLLSSSQTIALGAVHKEAFALSAAANAWAIDGTTYSTGTPSFAMPLALTRMRIGNTGLASNFMLNGYIRAVRYWPRMLSSAEMQQVTA